MRKKGDVCKHTAPEGFFAAPAACYTDGQAIVQNSETLPVLQFDYHATRKTLKHSH